MKAPNTIYEYLKQESTAYGTEEISIFSNWKWNMKRHIEMSFSLKHGIFYTGENNWMRPFKKVIEPILNLRYRAEDIDLTDVHLFTEDKNGRALSFLIKKYHDEVYIKEHDLDSFFDEAGEENIDLGGVLVQKGKDGPEVLPLQYIAFCDQTDIMGSPIGFKFYFSPDKLRTMSSRGWGNTKNGATISIEDLIELSKPEKKVNSKITNRTPGKQIEIHIIRGSLPEAYLKDNENFDDYYGQIHIVAEYQDKENHQTGVTLYRKEEDDSTLKFFTSKAVRGRALGVGGAEALFNEQIWTNFLEIHKMKLLESAAKVPLYTDDPNYQNRNKIQDMENLEITTIQDGKKIYQVPTAAPANIALFEKGINEWYQNAQLIGSAPNPLLGVHSPSRSFRAQQGQVQQAMEPHEYRRGKFAKFVEMIYRDWIIPDIVKELQKDKQFLASLSTEEMQWVSDRFAENHANSVIKEDILNGKLSPPREVVVQGIKNDFLKRGTKHMLEISNDDFKDVNIKLSIDIAGKQKNLADMINKVMGIFKIAFSNPQGFMQMMQIPGMGKSFNDILEFSGLSQVDFAGMQTMLQNQSIPQKTSQSPTEQPNLQPA